MLDVLSLFIVNRMVQNFEEKIRGYIMRTQKTFTLKSENAIKKWYHIDAEGLVVGRLATEITRLLKGKDKPIFTPNTDSGDFVVVTNCEKIVFTGNKTENKKYWWHTNHIGGIKNRTVTEQLQKHPELILMKAVKGMLPNNTLGRKQLTKLKLFTGTEHGHLAQKPEILKLSDEKLYRYNQ
jgi:large subunit ribosomal protein L13